MAVRTSFSDIARTGGIDRGLGLLVALILLVAGVIFAVFGMITFNSQAQSAAVGSPTVTTVSADFGLVDE